MWWPCLLTCKVVAVAYELRAHLLGDGLVSDFTDDVRLEHVELSEVRAVAVCRDEVAGGDSVEGTIPHEGDFE